MHAGLVQLAIGLEVQVEAALASILGDVSLPRGRRLLDLNVLDVHVGVWRSLCPVVGVLAHRVVCWRQIIKSEGVLPGRREEKTNDLILRKHERQTEGGGGCGFGCGGLGGGSGRCNGGGVDMKLLTTDHSRARERAAGKSWKWKRQGERSSATRIVTVSRTGWPGRRLGWGRRQRKRLSAKTEPDRGDCLDRVARRRERKP
jgi:hypothetical protein